MGASFSRAQAMKAKNNASTAILRSALTNYINATKNMNANKIRAALNNKRIGLTESYKNRIANAVANAVIKARKANVAVAAANLGAASETVAAVHVNNAANKLANLNKYMNTISGYTNNNNKVNQYITTKRNLNANRALNAGRNGGPKYANFFKLVNIKKVGATKQGPANANQRQASTGANGNNNMAIVNKAIATKELSELNSAKLLNAAANKLKNSNNKNFKSNFVIFAKRQINKMNNENNKKKVRSAIMKVSPENNMFKQANNPNAPGLVLKSNKGQVGGVARNVYYVNGSPNRYIKNTNGKYIKLSNGNVNLGTWPAPNANARKVNFDPENGFIQTNKKA